MLSPKLLIGHPNQPVDNYTWGGMARATEDVAVAAWSAGSGSTGGWMRAVRWTTQGPVAGPLTFIAGDMAMGPSEVLEGRDGEVWIVGFGSMPGSGVVSTLVGIVTVNPVDLTLTQVWHDYPDPQQSLDYLAQSWPEEGLVVILNNGAPGEAPELMLIDVDTGVVVAQQTMSWVRKMEEMSLRGGVLAFWANRPDGTQGWSIWRMDITPTSFGSMTQVFDYANSQIQWVVATPVPDGWNFYMSTFAGFAFMGRYIAATDAVQTGIQSWWIYEVSTLKDLRRTQAAAISSSYGQYSNKYVQTIHASKQATQGVVYEYWDAATYYPVGESSIVRSLPGTTGLPVLPTRDSAFRDVAISVVAPERFLYFVAGRVGPQTAFDEAVWASGPDLILTPETGEQDLDGSRNTFRRNR